MRLKQIFFFAVLCAMLFTYGWLAQQAKILEGECSRLEAEIGLLEQENAGLREQRAQLGQRMEAWLDEWAVDVWESSAYAPLDPHAVEGMCFVGDPRITASGAEVIPYWTAAASPDIAFGTLVWVEGAGWRIVQDRGSGVGRGQVDLAMASRGEALRWGRRSVKVVYQK